MSPENPEQPVPVAGESPADRLDSWKEVAAYLKREVRTVQRWEKKEGLPIHRLQHDKLGSIYAYKSELDAWWNERRPRLEAQPEAPAEAGDLEPYEVPAIPAPLPEVTTRVSSLPRPGFTSASRAAAGLVAATLLILVIYSIRESFKPGKATPPPGKLMLVVLPFENLSNDPEQDHFSDGLTGEMITQISGLEPERLGVIARTTAMLYRKTQKTAEEIGRELGVDYILEGTVQREEDQVRVNGQLIQVSDQTHIWAQGYDRELRGILAVQSELAQAIADQIRLKLTEQTRARLANPPEINVEAYEAYLWGRQNSNLRTPDGLARGIAYFQKAIDKDPKYAPAYAGLSDALNLMAFYSFLPPKDTYPKARAAAEQALSLDATLAEPYAALGNLSYEYEYNWEKADKSFRRALELNPSYAAGRQWYGAFLTLWGKVREGREQSLLARKLDPLSIAIATDVSLTYYYARDFDRAAEEARKAIALDPNYSLGHFWLARALLQKGDRTAAIAAFKKALQVQPGNLLAKALLAHACGVAGQRAEAEAILRELQEFSRSRYLSPAYVSLVYLGLGDYEKALDWGERAWDERAGLLTRLNMDPISDGMRNRPRFKNLIKKLGITPESPAR